MNKQGDVKPVKRAANTELTGGGLNKGPEARLLSLLNATQSTLTIEPAGRVVYINLSRAFFQAGRTGDWLQYLTQQHVSAVAGAYWISSAVFLALPFCGHLHVITVLLPVCVQLVSAAPALLCSMASLNIDIVCVLLTEYEFRFVTLLNAINWVATAAAFGDVRAASCGAMWMATQIAFMVDANARSLESALKTSFALIPTLLVVLAFSFADALGDSNTRIAEIGTRKLSIHDVLLTTAPTLALFLGKTVYHQRSRLHARPRLPGTNLIYCSIHQKRLTLQKVLPSASRRQARISPHLVANPGIPLLRSHVVMSHVYTENTLFETPWQLVARQFFPMQLLFLYLAGVWGFLALVYASIAAQLHRDDSEIAYHQGVPYSALAATIFFCSVFASMLQRDLALALVRTFDVAFSSLQFSVASLCLCDMMRWDSRCVNVLTWWLWFHWMLVLDALTPPVRALLHFKKFPASGVVLFAIYAYLTVFILLYYYDDTHLLDRAWVTTIATSTRPPYLQFRLPLVRTESVLVGRLVTLTLWNARLLWDLGVRADAELVFLRDLVEYYTSSESNAQLLGLATLSPRRMFFGSISGIAATPSSSQRLGRMGAVHLQNPLRPPSSTHSYSGDRSPAASMRRGTITQLDLSACIDEEEYEDVK